MIRYALLCRTDHAFEAWFPDSAAYDRQRADGQVACPVCGDAEIRKAIMAPAVRRSGRRPVPVEVQVTAEPATGGEAMAPVPAGSVTVESDAAASLRAAVRELHARLKRDATDVGAAFPARARAMHEGEEPQAPIYGTATPPEVRSLLEDGIGVVPIPPLPDDRN